jgi:ribulose-phosphate 3-epimerase
MMSLPKGEKISMSKVKVAPSILSADFANMAQAVKNLKEWEADWVHCDVMDGVYVPNITFGMPMVKALRKYSDMFFDVHLMITEPEKYVGEFCDCGADMVTFHPEASKNPLKAIEIIKSKGKMCGVVLNADQPFEVIAPYLDKVDMVLIMTVQAGFGGQSFREDRLEMARKVKEIKKENGYSYHIQLDGGVCPSNIAKCVEAGADVVVAGSAVFKAQNPKEAVASMQIDCK